MKMNSFVDIIGRLLIMSWIFVFIIYFAIDIEFPLIARIIFAIFIIWWAIIPYLKEKEDRIVSDKQRKVK